MELERTARLVGTIGKLSQSACWPSVLINFMAVADYFGLHRCRPAAKCSRSAAE